MTKKRGLDQAKIQKSLKQFEKMGIDVLPIEQHIGAIKFFTDYNFPILTAERKSIQEIIFALTNLIFNLKISLKKAYDFGSYEKAELKLEEAKTLLEEGLQHCENQIKRARPNERQKKPTLVEADIEFVSLIDFLSAQFKNLGIKNFFEKSLKEVGGWLGCNYEYCKKKYFEAKKNHFKFQQKPRSK